MSVVASPTLALSSNARHSDGKHVTYLASSAENPESGSIWS